MTPRTYGCVSAGVLGALTFPRTTSWVALKEMKGWDDEVILPAEKGNATVVMERSDYKVKVRELLKDTSTYRRLPKDPTQAQETKISRMLRELHKKRLRSPSTIDSGLLGPNPPYYTVYPRSTNSPI